MSFPLSMSNTKLLPLCQEASAARMHPLHLVTEARDMRVSVLRRHPIQSGTS